MQFADVNAIGGESAARICAVSASNEPGRSAQFNAQGEGRRRVHFEHSACRSGAAIGEPYATVARGVSELTTRQCASVRFGSAARDERKRQDADLASI